MLHYTPKTKVQSQFLTNIERARSAGVETKTSQAVYHALLGGLTYCNFNGVAQPLTDDYLMACEDYLYDKAVEAGQQNNIKWVGIE